MSELKALLTHRKVDFSSVILRKDLILLCQTHSIRASLLQDLPDDVWHLIQETGRGRAHSKQIRHRREEDAEMDPHGDTPLVMSFRSGVTNETVHCWPYTGLRTQSVRLSLMENSKHKMKFVSCHFPPPDSGEVPAQPTESHDGSFSLTLEDFHEKYMGYLYHASCWVEVESIKAGTRRTVTVCVG
jgi:hypothetical protein